MARIGRWTAAWVLGLLWASAVWAGGSISYGEIKERFADTPEVLETLEMALEFLDGGYAEIRVMHPHPERFVGRRIGPYRLFARQKFGARRWVEVELVTDAASLDAEGKATEWLDERTATIKETLTGLRIAAAPAELVAGLEQRLAEQRQSTRDGNNGGVD